jgi:transposase-like protein
MRMDERGRVRVPRERREAILDEFERSGLSAAKFARLAGINYTTFSNWRQVRRKAAEAQQPPEASLGGVRLVEALLEGGVPAAKAGGLLIELPGGGRMHIESPMQLRMAAELLSMMAQNVQSRC